MTEAMVPLFRARSDYERLLVKFKNNPLPPRRFDVETVRMFYAAASNLRVANRRVA